MGVDKPPTTLAGESLGPNTEPASVGLPSPPKAPEPRAPRGVKGGERPYGSKCVGVRKEEWGVGGEMKGAEDGLTAPVAENRLGGLVRS